MYGHEIHQLAAATCGCKFKQQDGTEHSLKQRGLQT